MNICPADSYSILNNYEYSNKSKVVSVLDVLSTPVRRILGGRNVSLISLKVSEEWSKIQKKGMCLGCTVVALGGSLLIPVVPVLGIILVSVVAISALALAIKALSLPWLWQKKSLQNEYDASLKKIDDFVSKFDSGQILEALSILRDQPGLAHIPRVQERLVNHIQQMIIGERDKDDIAELIKTLPRKKGIDLVHSYISHTLVKSVYLLDPIFLRSFIASSLRFEGLARLKQVDLYKKILPTLALNSADFPIFKYYKMDIADRLIQDIVLSLDFSDKKNKENELRLLIVDLSDPSLGSDYNYFFVGEASYNHDTLQKLRYQDKLCHHLLSDSSLTKNREALINLFERTFSNDLLSLKLQTLRQKCLDQLKASTTDSDDALREEFKAIEKGRYPLFSEAVEMHVAHNLMQVYLRLKSI